MTTLYKINGDFVGTAEIQSEEMVEIYKADGWTESAPDHSYFDNNKLSELRTVRNALLKSTDWWASSDLTMTAEQAAYRQALRDITDTYTSIDDVVWPTKPE